MAAVAVGITMGDGACRWMSPAISDQNIAVTITDHNLRVTITVRPSGIGPQEFGFGPTAGPLLRGGQRKGVIHDFNVQFRFVLRDDLALGSRSGSGFDLSACSTTVVM